MRAAVVLAALTSLVAAAPQIQISTGEIGLIFTFTNGSQSGQQWIADSASPVPLSTYPSNLERTLQKRVINSFCY